MTLKIFQERQKEGIRTIQMRHTELHHSEVSHKATLGNLQHQSLDQADLKHPSTGRINNGVVDIIHLPNEKLIISPKIRFQFRIREPCLQPLPSHFQGDQGIKITRIAVRTAFCARHLEEETPQSILCLQSRTCKHTKRNEL